MRVRPAAAADAAAIAGIYNHYITNTLVTFEEVPVDGAEMARRMSAVSAADLPWLVSEDDGIVTGFAYATKWNPRIGYRYSVETTVYLAHDRCGRGTGTALYVELFRLLEARGIHVAIGGIALPNAPSVALHEKFGMRQVAQYDEVGFKFGQWLSVGYWQRYLGSPR